MSTPDYCAGVTGTFGYVDGCLVQSIDEGRQVMCNAEGTTFSFDDARASVLEEATAKKVEALFPELGGDLMKRFFPDDGEASDDEEEGLPKVMLLINVPVPTSEFHFNNDLNTEVLSSRYSTVRWCT